MANLTKLDKALDIIADVFFDPAEGRINKDGSTTEPRNKQAWAQRDVLQAIAWKANSALERANGADERMSKLKAEASAMAQKPTDEIDMVEAARIARDAEFWGFQQSGLETLMEAASAALVRHGHDAYERRDMRKRSTSASANQPASTADLATMFSALGVDLPQREA